MKIWQIVCVVTLLTIVAFNPKVQLFKIFSEQFKVYRNDKTNRVSIYDIITFLIIPIILATIVAFSLSYKELSEASEIIITVFSLVATLLLSFLAMLVDKTTTNNKEKTLVKETFATITIDIIYSIFVVFLFAVPLFVKLNTFFEHLFVGMVAFFIIKILLNIFVILKRVFAVLR